MPQSDWSLLELSSPVFPVHAVNWLNFVLVHPVAAPLHSNNLIDGILFTWITWALVPLVFVLSGVLLFSRSVVIFASYMSVRWHNMWYFLSHVSISDWMCECVYVRFCFCWHSMLPRGLCSAFSLNSTIVESYAGNIRTVVCKLFWQQHRNLLGFFWIHAVSSKSTEYTKQPFFDLPTNNRD